MALSILWKLILDKCFNKPRSLAIGLVTSLLILSFLPAIVGFLFFLCFAVQEASVYWPIGQTVPVF